MVVVASKTQYDGGSKTFRKVQLQPCPITNILNDNLVHESISSKFNPTNPRQIELSIISNSKRKLAGN